MKQNKSNNHKDGTNIDMKPIKTMSHPSNNHKDETKHRLNPTLDMSHLCPICKDRILKPGHCHNPYCSA